MKLILLWLLLAAPALAQQMPVCQPDHSNAPCIVLPDNPTPLIDHRFIDTQNLSMFWTSATALAAEAATSCNQPGGSLSAPVAKSCGQTAIGAVGFFTAEIMGAALLHRFHHHTLERGLSPSTTLFHLGRLGWISLHRP